jgi:beta-lactamase class A
VVGIAAVPSGGGYWIPQGSKPNVYADLFSPGLVASLDGRAGVITAAVLDLTTGELYQYRPGQEDITASIVKVQILGTLLHEATAEGRNLSASEQALAALMIQQSDNDAATALWDEVGGAPAVLAFDRAVGMGSTEPNFAWGLTVTDALDQITLLEHLVLSNPVLSSADRDYALSLMESVVPDEAWGVSAGAAAGTTVALKNGWLPVGSTWQINSVGWVSGAGRDYLIAVLTSGDPSEEYGIESVSEVAEAAWAALGHA